MKNSYILLRDNKESGPHGLADLEKLGLKANDLIWVEGQSVCWLHPAEIAELKSFPSATSRSQSTYSVPFKEERELATATENNNPVVPEKIIKVTTTMPVIEEEPELVTIIETADPVIPEKNNTTIPVSKKSVFISMPSGKKAAEEVYKPSPVTSPLPEPVSQDEEPVETMTRYSQPLDEIKEMYVQKLQDRKKKAATKKNLVRNLRAAAVIAGLLGIGLFAGILLQKGNDKKTAQTNDTAKQAVQPETITPPIITPVDPGTTENLLPENNGTIPAETIIDLPEDPTPVKPVTSKTKKNAAPVSEDETVDNHSGPQVINASNGERNSKTRQDAAETQTVTIESISPLVSVKSNEYKIAAFGGIKDLQLTVTNDSKYILDNVQVEIQYLKPSEETVKTETLYFKTVPPNGTQTIAVPRSSRGVKVNYRITRIESKQINGVAGLQP